MFAFLSWSGAARWRSARDQFEFGEMQRNTGSGAITPREKALAPDRGADADRRERLGERTERDRKELARDLPLVAGFDLRRLVCEAHLDRRNAGGREAQRVE